MPGFLRQKRHSKLPRTFDLLCCRVVLSIKAGTTCSWSGTLSKAHRTDTQRPKYAPVNEINSLLAGPKMLKEKVRR